MMNKHWPPDYLREYQKRIKRIKKLKTNPKLMVAAYNYYRDKPAEFINDWCITYDPRAKIKKMPFILFHRQVELVEFLFFCITNKVNGLVEKPRDVGVTWVCCAFSIWLWIYDRGSSVGWGSRKEMLVDRLGDPDSIFEKMRMLIDNLPGFFLPPRFDSNKNLSFMKIIDPEYGSTIKGEAGSNIGRGGRSKIYFKDEGAYYEQPEKIEAALGDNTDVQIDISSVNGTGNVFHRRRKAGILWKSGIKPIKSKTHVFIIDWRDHPAKTQEWYDARRAKAEEEGLLHLFAQEIDRDYASAVVGVVIPTAHIKAAIDAHIKLGFEAEGLRYAGLDVADEEGVDTNAIATRKGVVLKSARQWGGLDTTKTAQEAVHDCNLYGIDELFYDCIGVGAGVRGETNRLKEKGGIKFKVQSWNAALSGKALPRAEKHVISGDRKSPKNKDFYASMKSMAWWNLKLRFEKTYKAVTKGDKYDPEELISISSDIENLHIIEEELSQVTWKKSDNTGKIIINKQPPGTKSPNIADAIVMCYFPPVKNIEFRVA